MKRLKLLFLLSACSAQDQPADGAALDSTMDHADVASIDAPSDSRIDVAAEDVTVDAGCGAGYPAGPYGNKVGDVIDNLTFAGKRDVNMNGTFSDDSPTMFCLGQYRLNPQIKAISITAVAAWSGPDQQEEPQTVKLYQSYQQAGGHVAFFEAMIENAQLQTPTMGDLTSWGNTYKEPYDLALDPMRIFLLTYAPQPAVPIHLVIRANTMQIASAWCGFNTQVLQSAIDAVTGMPLDSGTD